MKLQTVATRVAARTSELLKRKPRAEASIDEPAWYRVVVANPPTHQLLPKLRTLKQYVEEEPRKTPEFNEKTGLFATRHKARFNTRSKHLYRLPRIEYAEDKIRRLFYANHPWELARPRNMIEKDGRSYIKCDWSTIRQPSLQLSGENVVRRTMWLAAQPSYVQQHGSDWYEAYKQARLEFYRLRIEENAEQQVAAEEAVMNGAVFASTYISRGLEVEQKVIDKYIEIARESTEKDAQVVTSRQSRSVGGSEEVKITDEKLYSEEELKSIKEMLP